jgi:hypothetical protein
LLKDKPYLATMTGQKKVKLLLASLLYMAFIRLSPPVEEGPAFEGEHLPTTLAFFT